MFKKFIEGWKKKIEAEMLSRVKNCGVVVLINDEQDTMEIQVFDYEDFDCHAVLFENFSDELLAGADAGYFCVEYLKSVFHLEEEHALFHKFIGR